MDTTIPASTKKATSTTTRSPVWMWEKRKGENGARTYVARSGGGSGTRPRLAARGLKKGSTDFFCLYAIIPPPFSTGSQIGISYPFTRKRRLQTDL